MLVDGQIHAFHLGISDCTRSGKVEGKVNRYSFAIEFRSRTRPHINAEKMFKKLSKMASDAAGDVLEDAVGDVVDAGAAELVDGVTGAIEEATGQELGDVAEMVAEKVEEEISERVMDKVQDMVVDELKDRLGITENGKDDEENEENGNDGESDKASEVEEAEEEAEERRQSIVSERSQVNGNPDEISILGEEDRRAGEAYWKQQAMATLNEGKEDEEEEEEKEPEDMTPSEVYKATAPPPQPAPRANLEERTVNLNYWKQQSIEEEAALAREDVPEVVETLVEEVKEELKEEIKEEIREEIIEEIREEIKEAEEEREEVVLTVTEENKVLVNEKNLSNEEVLNKMIEEGELEPEDMPSIQQLLAAAKKTRKPKTETFIIRTKKRQESIRKAVDYSAMAIVIEDKNKTATKTSSQPGTKTIKTGGRTFEVSKAAANAFQVRKDSMIQPASETVVTKKWIQNAIASYEKESPVEIVDMHFETKNQGQAVYYEARVTAKVGERNTQKSYSWVIRPAARLSVDASPNDRDTYIVSDLGSKIASFVASKKLRKPISLPFQPVIYADSKYAIMDDISSYKTVSSGSFLDLDHMKQALKALARLHAMSYAYFNRGSDDVKQFSEALKMIVAKQYQQQAQPEDKNAAKDFLERMFENMLGVVTSNGGDDLSKRAAKKFSGQLYPIYKDAFASTSAFSVLNHGFPQPENMYFSYDSEGRPTDVKLTGFQRARYAHAATDLQLLFSASAADRVDDQTEFLLRIVYFETLSSTLRSLGAASTIDFDAFKKSFRKLQVFGCLSGAMKLAETLSPMPKSASASIKRLQSQTSTGSTSNYGVPTRRATGKRVFESKIVGNFGGSSAPPKASASAAATPAPARELFGPALRINELLERALRS